VQVSQAALEASQQHDVYFASNVGSVCRGMTTRQEESHMLNIPTTDDASAGTPHGLPTWARPGNGPPKSSSGLPRKRRKTAGAAQASVQAVTALPPPMALGQSQASAARQAWQATGQAGQAGQAAGKAVRPAKRPYKPRVPAAAGSLQTAAFNARSSSGMVGQVTPFPSLEHPVIKW
jgi:hypothetical protein